jgi:hypothetical protein
MRGAIRHYGTTTRPFDGSKPDFGLKLFSESRAFSPQSPVGRATYQPAAAASCLYAPKISFNGPVAEADLSSNTDAIARSVAWTLVVHVDDEVRRHLRRVLPIAVWARHARCSAFPCTRWIDAAGQQFPDGGDRPVKRNWPGTWSYRANPAGPKAGDLRATRPEYLPSGIVARIELPVHRIMS